MENIRILVDLDNTLYDLCTPWLLRYNNDYPHHKITTTDIKGWDTSQYVAADCGKKIYDYFLHEDVWTSGDIIDPISVDVTKMWLNLGYEVAVCTTASNAQSIPWKMRWLDFYFPHIKERIITTGHTKHWIEATFLIDDGPHNHKDFTGISILYDAPWNRDTINLPRAANWSEVYRLVMRGIHYLRQDVQLKETQDMLAKDFGQWKHVIESIQWT